MEMKVSAGCRGRYISSAICSIINQVFIYLSSACEKIMSSVMENRVQIGGALRS